MLGGSESIGLLRIFALRNQIIPWRIVKDALHTQDKKKHKSITHSQAE